MTPDGSEPKKASKPRVALTRQHTRAGVAAELVTLLQTVAEDGTVSDQEAEQLRTWLDDNQSADLPAIAFLRGTVNQILADGRVTETERRELFKAVERVLPADLRASAKAKRIEVEAAEKLRQRVERDERRAKEQAERERNQPIAQANFMVAGVQYEGRAEVVAAYAEADQTVFLVRDPNNAYDGNAVEVRLPNGMQIGFMPREDAAQFAPLMDSGYLQQAYMTKILDGRRALIPVVQAYLYKSDATAAGAVSSYAVPPKTAAPSSLTRTGQSSEATGTSGCGTCMGAALVLFLLLMLVVCGLAKP